MKHRIYISILSVLCETLFSGCVSGPEYSDTMKSTALTPHDGKGMVIVYWTPGFVSAACRMPIYVNGVMIGKLRRGGFYSFEAIPGQINVAYSKVEGESTDKTKTESAIGGVLTSGIIGGILNASLDNEAHRKVGVIVNVVANQTTYVRMDNAGPPLSAVSKEQGDGEIGRCHWLNGSGQ